MFQSEVAESLKMSIAYLSEIENAKRPNAALLVFLRLSEFYGVPLEQMIINAKKSAKENNDF